MGISFLWVVTVLVLALLAFAYLVPYLPILAMRALILVCLLFARAVGQQSAPLAEFSLPKLVGQKLGSRELKDNIVVLDFWATWCENCVSEIPAFNKLEKEYGSRGVKVIGLAVQSGWASDIQKFAKQYNMRYTILVGNDDTVSDFGIISFPATYVIGPGWKFYKKYSGSPDNKSADIERDIETLLKAKAGT
jgi:thiol-disulfide isomerase/thioredoxin